MDTCVVEGSLVKKSRLEIDLRLAHGQDRQSRHGSIDVPDTCGYFLSMQRLPGLENIDC